MNGIDLMLVLANLDDRIKNPDQLSPVELQNKLATNLAS